MKGLKLIVFAVAVGVAASCSSNKVEQPSNMHLPDWVFQPEVENGIASAQCAKFSGNVSLDQQMLTAQGRASLAQQINVRAQVLDKTYQNRTDADAKSTTGNTFESVSKQLSDQTLIGSKLMKTEFGTVNKDQYICGMVGITPEQTKKLFNAIVENPNAPKTSAKDQDIMYQEFKAYKAHQDLDQALIENKTN